MESTRFQRLPDYGQHPGGDILSPDLLALFLPLQLFFPDTYALHFLMTSVAMYFWLYRKTSNSTGSFIGAFVWTWCGFNATNLIDGFYGFAFAPFYLPVCLILVDLLVERRKLVFAIALVFTFSLQLLAGHPQPFLYTVYFLSAYVLWRSICLYRQKEIGAKAAMILLAIIPLSVILAGLVCGVATFPMLEISNFSAARSGGASYEFATRDSLPFSALLVLVSPFVFGRLLDDTYWMTLTGYQEICGYLGVLPLFLAVIALKKRWERPFLFSMAFLSLLFAFGRNTLFYHLVYWFVPGFKWFRVPARMLMIWSFSASALAGLGAADLLE